METTSHIYLDYAATTPIASEVLEAMMPYFSKNFGNPASIHRFGQKADASLENTRQTVANFLGCQTNEIIFTSGGTESDNLAIRGCALAQKKYKGANHILITPVEHHAVTHTALQLAEYFDFQVEFLPVDQFGMVSPSTLQEKIRENTALVSIIYGNNEIGTINPISELGLICQKHGIPFHTDAVQATTYLPMQVNELNVNMLSIGAHKFYGPKGVGVLYVKENTPLLPVQTGGGQEFGKRSGTPNIPYIVGLGAALNFVQDHRSIWSRDLLSLRNMLIETVLNHIPGAQLTGHPVSRLPNHASFVFDGVDSQKLLMLLDSQGFACSSGSACKTGNPSPSDVLLALGLSPSLALSSLRVTLGKDTDSHQIELFLSTLLNSIEKCKSYGTNHG
jgi:cysteine desulfurase